MRISIQNQDIQLADRADLVVDSGDAGSYCPTAQALARLGYAEAYVGENYATVKRGEWRGRFALPQALTEQVQAWDSGFGFKAGDYDLLPVKLPPRDQVRR